MQTFTDYERPAGPEKTTGSIISHAFDVYKGMFLYGLAAMVLSSLISGLLSAVLPPLTGLDIQAMVKEMQSSPDDFFVGMWAIPGLKMYYGLSALISFFLTPLYVGVIYVANKYDTGQPISLGDLFISYRQNFLNILVYSVIYSIIIAIGFMMCVLPGFLLLPFFLLGYPILLFENATFSEALNKSFAIAKSHYGVLLGAGVLGMFISAIGLFLCGIGIVFTLPFILVVMYSAYCAFCGRPRIVNAFKN